MKYFLPIVAFLMAIGFSSAQDPLPRFLTSQEKQMLERGEYQPPFIESSNMTHRTSPNVRAMAEWEELQAVVIAWRGFNSILAGITKAALRECDVVIIYHPAQSSLTNIKNILISNGVDPESNIHYVEKLSNSIWIRDYGANPVYMDGVDSLAFVDWIYNRPRPLDDLVPEAVAEHFEVPLLSTTTPPEDLVHTGGNFMSDGLGKGFSSLLVLEENGPNGNFGITDHDEEAVNDIMNKYMQISEYPKFENLPYDAIHHIDMHMKLLDEETLLVGQYPEGIADGPQIEANIQYLVEQFQTSYGREFEIVRIPMPPGPDGRYPHQGGDYRTYVNSLFINNTVLVPVYEEKYDTTGLRIWRETMPGYDIVGINCNSIIPLFGALHCITKEVGVYEPLVINHKQVRTAKVGEEVTFTASARHKDGIKSMDLFYRMKGDEEYHQVNMEKGEDDDWIISLPSFENKSEIQYYFTAEANTGKKINRPMPAPEGYFDFPVEEQSTPVADLRKSIEKFNVFPNPASAITCIDISLKGSENIECNLITANGQVIENIYSGEINAQRKLFFNAKDYPPGMYFVELKNNSSNALFKVTIQ